MYSEEKYSCFAKEFIAGRELSKSSDFPFDIWNNMGENGFFENHDPSVLNGESTKFRNLSRASYALAKDGGCIGFVLSFLIHEIVSGFVLRRFGKSLNSTFFSDLARGAIISFAVSEPQAGAHPKFIKTTAVKDGDHYILNGSKAYITNGPIAEHFIIIAVTEENPGKRKFTAFYVPSETCGLTKTEPMNIPFFKPAPHGGIELKDCRVKKENIIGTLNCAWDEIVIPFGIIENSLMAGVVAGGVEKQLELLASAIKKEELIDDLLTDLGELKSVQETLLVLSSEMAKHADSYGFYEEHFSLLITFRKLAGEFQKLSDSLIEKMKLPADSLYNDIKNDLTGSNNIAKGTLRLRKIKLGKSLIFP